MLTTIRIDIEAFVDSSDVIRNPDWLKWPEGAFLLASVLGRCFLDARAATDGLHLIPTLMLFDDQRKALIYECLGGVASGDVRWESAVERFEEFASMGVKFLSRVLGFAIVAVAL
jgi:hypothetical protein